jgi:hypothetical protein
MASKNDKTFTPETLVAQVLSCAGLDHIMKTGPSGGAEPDDPKGIPSRWGRYHDSWARRCCAGDARCTTR